MSLKSIDDIKNCVFINLEYRKDRFIHTMKQFNNLKIPTKQFKAIQNKNGAIGCYLSHLRCLENAKKDNLNHIMIVEDDITFLDVECFKSQINIFLKNHDNWDVLLISGNNMPPFINIDNTCIKVTKCQTTTGYIVKSHYFDTLIANMKEGVLKLLNEPYNHRMYAIDKWWFHLQNIHNWYLLIPLCVIQCPGYSDIEKTNTDYSKAMLDFEKKTYFY
jgi:GR25 family glycosyltransferase involved in LPS biosynthesis